MLPLGPFLASLSQRYLQNPVSRHRQARRAKGSLLAVEADSGRIAGMFMNHLGDEAMKVVHV